jgi:membrane-associated phospholipid phosphatase
MQRRVTETSWPAWSWRVLAIAGAVDVAWLLASPISLDTQSTVAITVLIAFAIAIQMAIGLRPVDERVRVFATGLSFMLIAWPTLRVLNHLTMTTAFPLVDARLAAWDAALGFDWLAYVRWADQSPGLLAAMDLTYQGLTLYSLITFLVLLWVYGPGRAREFILIFFVTALAATLIGMFFPADCAMAYYRPDPAQFRYVTPAFGAYHLEAMHALRAGLPQVMSLQELPGLVTFPSFHTAMGIVGIYCCRGRLPVLAVSLAVNGTMIAATPVFGGHYIVDLMGGTLLALLAASLVTGSERRLALVMPPALNAGNAPR